jgi:dienelactone hydrolase
MTRPVFEDYTLPPYVDIDKFREYPVKISKAPWILPAALSLPVDKTNVPGVVLVHGLGPHDREESIGPNKPFRDLAWGLVTRGIAVLRYDKRTLVYAAQLAAIEGGFTTRHATIDDALAGVELLRGNLNIDPKRLYVLGHSFGGTLLPRIAKRDSGIAGLISLAAHTRPLEDVLLEQITLAAALDGKVTPAEVAHLERFKRQVAKVKDPKLSPRTPKNELPLGFGAAYWLDLRGYHPGQAAKKLKIPMLILHGGRDHQVTDTDISGWTSHLTGRDAVTFKTYPSCNHLMSPGQGASTRAEYYEPGKVAQEVIDDIANWILQGPVRSVPSQVLPK